MTKTLTEAQAWRALAKALVEKQSDMPFGLCALLESWGDWREFDVNAVNLMAMQLRLEAHYWACANEVWLGPKGVKKDRVIFCLFMALEAEDDAND